MPHSVSSALVLLGALYWLPTIVSWYRGLPARWGIFILNLLLGFTGIGWVILLCYSMLAKQSENDGFV